MSKIFKIYRLTNRHNGKVRIGWTSLSVQQRFDLHWSNAVASKRNGEKLTHFVSSILKHGKDAYDIEWIYSSTSLDEIIRAETHFILEHDSYHNGYNDSEGGEGAGIDFREYSDSIQNILAQLPKLYLEDDLSMAEIGRRLDVDQRTVRAYLEDIGIYDETRAKNLPHPAKNQDMIFELYVNQNKSLKEVSRLSENSIELTKKHLVEIGAYRENSKNLPPISKDELETLYQSNTRAAIAKQFGVGPSVIISWLEQYDIPIRRREISKDFLNVDRETLYRLYITEEKSALALSKEFGVSHQTLMKRLEVLDIPVRSQSEAATIRDSASVLRGRTQSAEERQMRSELMKEICKRPEVLEQRRQSAAIHLAGRKGADHGRSLTWNIVNQETGETFQVIGLKTWLAEQGLTSEQINKTAGNINYHLKRKSSVSLFDTADKHLAFRGLMISKQN